MKTGRRRAHRCSPKVHATWRPAVGVRLDADLDLATSESDRQREIVMHNTNEMFVQYRELDTLTSQGVLVRL